VRFIYFTVFWKAYRGVFPHAGCFHNSE
jgi:hypothetical protein